MRTLVVGDVHGCAAELRRLVERVRPDRLVLVGDLYTKGPDPAGVWTVLREWDGVFVRGNHDQRLIDAIDGHRPTDREAERCLGALAAGAPGWQEALVASPLWREVEGRLVVHAGLHPRLGTSGTTPAMALALRRWPEGEAEALPWFAQYEGDQPVIFGHDAKGGLVWRTRQGRAHVVGLDTGCVYGGVLSGLCLPDEALVQVPAERAWAPIGKEAA